MQKLTKIETRVLGVLMEKEVTTPDQYPLSLNGLTTACNQKSNREPIMNLSEAEVQGALDLLKSKHWLMQVTGQRTQKFKQRFCNTEFSDFQFSDQERSIICLLLVRGAQTSGELRARSQRMTHFNDVAEVEVVLDTLANYASGPLVRRLEREPGKREVRYVQLLSEEGDYCVNANEDVSFHEMGASSSAQDVSCLMQRIDELEQRVMSLENKLTSLGD